MILYFLALAVVLFFILSKIAGLNHKPVLEGLLSGIAIFLFPAFLVSAISIIDRRSRFTYTEEKYNYLKYIVENCEVKAEDQVESIEFDIRKEVMDMNNTISEHKVGSESFLFSPWYSAEIGKLETIALNQH